jgi:hypothetical protein
MSTAQHVLPQFKGVFNRKMTQYFDYFYVALSNLSFGTPLPAWVDQNFFYLPFDLNPPPWLHGLPLELTMFQGSTIGFGAEAACVALLPNEEFNGVHFDASADGSSVQFTTSYLDLNGTSIACYPHELSIVSNQTTEQTGSFSGSFSALKVVQQMTPATDAEDAEFCNSRLVFGWVCETSTLANNSLNNNTLLERSLDSTFLSRTYNMRIAGFDILVDAGGHVLEANQTSPLPKTLQCTLQET